MQQISGFGAGIIALAAMVASSPALARDDIALSRAIFVERTVDAGGQRRIVLEPPHRIASGDRLVFVVDYRNRGSAPAADFIVTNPLPATVAYQSSVGRAAIVSIDRGRSWGRLADLRVRDEDGALRHARPEDVTHVRWALPAAIPAGQGGTLSFRGVVR